MCFEPALTAFNTRFKHDLFEAGGVAQDFDERGGHGHVYFGRPGDRGHVHVDGLDDLDQVHGLALDGETGVGPSQLEQVVDKLRHAFALAANDRERVDLFGARFGTPQDVVGVSDDGGHGGAQFVRGVGGKAPLRFERLLQAFQHIVERDREFLEFVVGFRHRHPLRQVAAVDKRGGRGHAFQGRKDA